MPRESLFAGYDLDAAYDEMFEQGGQARSHCGALFDDLRVATPGDLLQRQIAIESALPA